MKSLQLDLNGINKVTAMLVQSLLGAVSPNFRMVALGFFEPEWQLLFVLEKESVEDRERIQDVVEDFDALLMGLNSAAAELEMKTIVSAAPLAVLDPYFWRVVFLRREVC
jgi:hypothetical protein